MNKHANLITDLSFEEKESISGGGNWLAYAMGFVQESILMMLEGEANRVTGAGTIAFK